MATIKDDQRDAGAIALGRRVASRRKKLGISQTRLAEEVGMKQQGFDAIENGRVKRPKLLREIAKALRTNEEWLLHGKLPEEIEEASAAELAASLVHVPLISWVSAGRMADANSQIPLSDVPLLAFADLGPGDYFATRVKGDSMDRISPDRSIIVVNRRERAPEVGRPFLFAYEGEMTYKLWQPEPARLEPFSTNPLNHTIFIKRKRDLEIIGRVRRTVLDL